MAGAGYKLFNTGDVLTAAQVNTYLMEQSVMVFADAAARTTALTGVVAEGMLSYLKDTNAVEVYDGANWVASDDPNAIQNTIVDAKGDLVAASADNVPARLAVGNNGETLVADSSTTTGLRYREDYAAGKNKIINGDFNIWQRGTSFTGAMNGVYTADRWLAAISTSASGLAWTVSQQSFTLGTAPVAGYEGTFFIRADITTIGSATSPRIGQRIENVRTFAGQTVTVSWFGRSSTSTSITNGLQVVQNFGSGGSSAAVLVGQTITYTSSFQRFTHTFSVPSISGKTIGAGSYLEIRYNLEAADSANLDIWGVQVEAGSVATAFNTATGTLAGELAACQRYYYRQTSIGNLYTIYGLGFATSTTNIANVMKLPVTMRVIPTSVDFATIGAGDGSTVLAASAVAISSSSNVDTVTISNTVTGATQNRPYYILSNNSTASYLGLSAEL